MHAFYRFYKYYFTPHTPSAPHSLPFLELFISIPPAALRWSAAYYDMTGRAASIIIAQPRAADDESNRV